MVKNAIEFQHISFQYADGNTKVLKDVNFSIPFGSVTLLTGRTGVGKTTLLRILTRVIPEDVSGTIYGNILVDGETIAKNSIVDVSKKIGFVMQDPECQIFHEDVHDELLFGMENNNVSKEEAYRREKEALDYTHLDRNSKTKTLSGGQKAMLINQSIILMRQNIKKLIVKLKQAIWLIDMSFLSDHMRGDSYYEYSEQHNYKTCRDSSYGCVMLCIFYISAD